MPRKQERTAVSLDIILEGLSGRHVARISDISLGGCFIDSVTPIRQGEIVAFKIKAAEDEWLAMRGEVVHFFAGLGFGVRFVAMTPEKQSVIEHIILMHDGNPWGGGEPENAGRDVETPIYERAA
ncbi:MAG: PilZ domain-containing protein [Acidobacteria bacterium]|nr:PilZ domain-containing protein [Acidobacteriota bacterium]